MKNYLLLTLSFAMIFAGCSKDESKENPNVKRVVDASSFEYDDSGRLTKSYRYPSIVYGTDSIEVTANNDGVRYYFTFYLNDKNLVKSYKYYYNDSNFGIVYLEYDDTEHLISTQGGVNFIWENGNIVKIRTKAADHVYTYSSENYIGNIAEYIGNPTFGASPIGSWCSFLSDYGYFGKRCKNLCIQYDTFEVGTENPAKAATQYKYEYTFDESGYVTKVIRRYMHYSNGYEGDPKTTVIKYKNL